MTAYRETYRKNMAGKKRNNDGPSAATPMSTYGNGSCKQILSGSQHAEILKTDNAI